MHSGLADYPPRNHHEEARVSISHDLRSNATCFARQNSRPVESSTSALVMDPARPFFPQWVELRRFKGGRSNLETLSVSQRRLAA
jgi:hypothetical protein